MKCTKFSNVQPSVLLPFPQPRLLCLLPLRFLLTFLQRNVQQATFVCEDGTILLWLLRNLNPTTTMRAKRSSVQASVPMLMGQRASNNGSSHSEQGGVKRATQTTIANRDQTLRDVFHRGFLPILAIQNRLCRSARLMPCLCLMLDVRRTAIKWPIVDEHR